MPTKKIVVYISALLFIASAQAQTLFTYGTYAVTKDAFIKAFNKNPDTAGNRQTRMNDYLHMYVNYKLKLQAAYDEHLDQQPSLQGDADNFKHQLAENYINQQANIQQLVQEAFVRSQHDIKVAEVFVEVAKNADTAIAWQQIQQAYKALQSGKNFAEVAGTYSTDAAIKQSKGDIGYITVFTLPYDIETIVYNLSKGSYSKVYRSNIGYHIFYKEDERKAAGKRKIQQILFTVGNNFSDADKSRVKQKADSIYSLLQKGASFDEMVQRFSGAANVNMTNGIANVNVGDYGNDFEDEVYALKNTGDISKPFVSGYGYNIIKLVEIIPVNTDANDVVTRGYLQQQVEKDGRLNAMKEQLTTSWLQQVGYKPSVYNTQDLWALTDSASKGVVLKSYKSIAANTTIFSFSKQNYTALDFINYTLHISRKRSAYPIMMNEYVRYACNQYYRSHIEDFNPAVKEQMQEFTDANLLFTVTDKHVWSKAIADSAALKKYYETHTAKYVWQPGVTALVVTAASKETVNEIADKLKTGIANWRTITETYGNSILADSNRFENDQLPVKNIKLQKGFQSVPQKTEDGTDYTFIYIFNVFPQKENRSFEDAKGLVINDYQLQLEAEWIDTLKKKYPVKINEAVLKTLQ
jgi:peptidyl-prolyl cis-trans isomerase SurA